MDKQEIIDFELMIKEYVITKQVRGPVHLRSNNEQILIDLFDQLEIDDDTYVICSWASHIHALLRKIPKEEIKEKILEGKSISLCFKKFKFFSSGIVCGNVGFAVGLGLSIKRSEKKEKVVIFLGDMAASLGITHEAIKICKFLDLPVWFVIEKNSLSVSTPTHEAWGSKDYLQLDRDYKRLIEYNYVNGYNHSGIGSPEEKLAF